MSVVGTLSLIVYSFGAFAFGFVCWYGLRDPAWRTWARRDVDYGANLPRFLLPIVMNWLSFVWFIVLIFRQLTGLTIFEMLFLCFALSYPGLILHMTYTETRAVSPNSAPGWIRWVYRLIYAVTTANIVALILAWTDINPMTSRLGAFSGINISVSFTLAALFSIFLLTRSRRERAERPRRSRELEVWNYALYFLMVLTVGSLVVLNFIGTPILSIVQMVGTSMPLLFCFVGVYEESRFEFFDLFIKRGATMLLTLLALIFYFGYIVPALGRLDSRWEPWLQAIVMLPGALALPAIHRKIGRWLDDRWLGRRFNGIDAVKHFLGELGAATDEAALIECAERGFHAIFAAPVEIATDTEGEGEAIHRVPIARGLGEIRLGSRANEMPWFSEDLALAHSLSDVLAHTLQNVRLQQSARELSLQASRSELKALRAQINPHFLFNALNAIAALIHKDPESADRTVEQLAEVFRYTLRGSETEWARLEDELEFVEAYLDVERARFGSRLAVSIEVEPSLRRNVIPTMMLQTLVENAVKHGVARARGPAKIVISARIEADGRARLEVADSGPGIETPRRGRRDGGHGLRSIRERLRGHFGDDAGLELVRDEADALTIARVVLPVRQTLSDEDSARGGAASA